jgi:hypothetical protein
LSVLCFPSFRFPSEWGGRVWAAWGEDREDGVGNNLGDVGQKKLESGTKVRRVLSVVLRTEGKAFRSGRVESRYEILC